MIKDYTTSRLWLVTMLLLWCTSISYAQPPGSGWILDFSDEFNDNSIDLNKWRLVDGFQEYRSEYVREAGGNLILESGVVNDGGPKSRGGRLDSFSKRSYTYGYYETRCKIASTNKDEKIWPAVWLGDNATDTELDIFEWLSENYEKNSGPNQSHHFVDNSNVIMKLPKNYRPTDWHKYAVLWTPNEISFYIDDKLHYRSSRHVEARNDQIFLILTSSADINLQNRGELSVGENLPDFYVDYIRIWRHNNISGVSGPGKPRVSIPGRMQSEDLTVATAIQAFGGDGNGHVLGFIDNGDWIDYEVNIQTAGNYTANYRVATATGGTIQLRVDGSSKGSKTIPNTGGWETYQNHSHTVNLPAGNHTIRLQNTGGNWNINDVNFTLQGGGGTGNSSGGNPIYTLRKSSNQAFALDGGNGAANGQNVKLWAYNQSNVNQQWVEINRGNGFYSYQKRNTNFCLDGGNNGANGQNVIIWPCNNTNQNQQWRKVSAGGNKFRLEKRNAPAYSLDGNAGGYNGLNVHIWNTSASNGNQQWVFTQVGSARVSDEEVVQKASLELSVYPNPAENVIHIDNLPSGRVKLTLYDLGGNTVLSESIASEGGTQISVSDMNTGLYVLRIQSEVSDQKIKVAIK